MKSSTFALLFALPTALATPIGDRLDRVFTVYNEQPTTTTAAVNSGLVTDGKGCDPNMGIAYTNTLGGASTSLLRGSAESRRNLASSSHPTTLYYSASGQLSGFSTDIYGSVEPTPLAMGYFTQISDKRYRISIGTRADVTNLCDADHVYEDAVGDALIIQPGTLHEEVPLTRDAAAAAGYMRGSCFDGMGYHFFKDLKSAPGSVQWVSDTLSPVVAMYDVAGDINAVFFASSDNQNGMTSTHEWEPVPLTNDLMCKNFCDDDCHWDGHGWDVWSTMHWYFKDHEQVKCSDFEGQEGWGDGTMKCMMPGLGCCLE
jgi:hypothetical protein